MRKIVVAALAAATGLAPAAVQARPIVSDGPRPVPNVRIHAPAAPQAGTTWAAPMAEHRMRSGDMRVDGRQRRSGFNQYGSYRVINRGGFVPGYWWAPRYGISNYGLYGFGQPVGGTRWVRYYDDALLIDRDGRVLGGRYGMDFDRYGEHWGEDDRGIPVYVGNGDFHPEERDYAWSERFERDGAELAYDRDYPYDYRYGGEGRMDSRGFGHRGAYGYGYGGTIVTETITTTTSPGTVHYVTEPVAVHRVKPRRAYRAARHVRAAPRCMCK